VGWPKKYLGGIHMLAYCDILCGTKFECYNDTLYGTKGLCAYISIKHRIIFPKSDMKTMQDNLFICKFLWQKTNRI
jgi:hypothetical protein